MLNDPPHALLNTPTATAPLPCGTKCLFGLQRRGTMYHTIKYKSATCTLVILRLPVSCCSYRPSVSLSNDRRPSLIQLTVGRGTPDATHASSAVSRSVTTTTRSDTSIVGGTETLRRRRNLSMEFVIN